jgi:hypothetical protein
MDAARLADTRKKNLKETDDIQYLNLRPFEAG